MGVKTISPSNNITESSPAEVATSSDVKTTGVVTSVLAEHKISKDSVSEPVTVNGVEEETREDATQQTAESSTSIFNRIIADDTWSQLVPENSWSQLDSVTSEAYDNVSTAYVKVGDDLSLAYSQNELLKSIFPSSQNEEIAVDVPKANNDNVDAADATIDTDKEETNTGTEEVEQRDGEDNKMVGSQGTSDILSAFTKSYEETTAAVTKTCEEAAAAVFKNCEESTMELTRHITNARTSSISVYNNNIETLARTVESLKVPENDKVSNSEGTNEEDACNEEDIDKEETEGMEISLQNHIGDTSTVADF